ncbi:MAG: circularly permuted type 2 ATP-grasp protein [Desulfobacterales bacterium]|nr:circularly permuted type 2 ATP-grasp protein [Desulfobacterales bacterium]
MEIVKGYHGEWNMGSPGGWEYQRMTQLLGEMAWDLVLDNIDVGVEVDFNHPQINAVPGFARMILRAHEKCHGQNAVHAVLLAEEDTLEVVLENKNFVDYLDAMDGVKASLAGPGHLSLKNGKVCCNGEEATVIFMDFNMNVLIKIGKDQDIRPIKEAVRQGILVNPRGMEPLGAKGLFEVITGKYGGRLSEDTRLHTPWTRLFHPQSTTGPLGEPIEDLIAWTEEHWENLVLKPAHGYSGHGIFVGYMKKSRNRHIKTALDAGDYIVQEMVPLSIWSEQTTWPMQEERSLYLKEWQTDFRCFITDEGLQGFLARFGGIPTNVGSGGGMQPLAVLKSHMTPGAAVDKINQALLRLGYKGYVQVQEEINRKAIEMGLTYLLGPIMIAIRPRILTLEHMAALKEYAHNLWNDAIKLEQLWRDGELDRVVQVSREEKELALSQPWRGGPALMVSDGLFSFGADLINEDDMDG